MREEWGGGVVVGAYFRQVYCVHWVSLNFPGKLTTDYPPPFLPQISSIQTGSINNDIYIILPPTHYRQILRLTLHLSISITTCTWESIHVWTEYLAGRGGGGIDEKEGRNRRLAQYIVNIEFTQTILIYLINTSQ